MVCQVCICECRIQSWLRTQVMWMNGIAWGMRSWKEKEESEAEDLWIWDKEMERERGRKRDLVFKLPHAPPTPVAA